MDGFRTCHSRYAHTACQPVGRNGEDCAWLRVIMLDTQGEFPPELRSRVVLHGDNRASMSQKNDRHSHESFPLRFRSAIEGV